MTAKKITIALFTLAMVAVLTGGLAFALAGRDSTQIAPGNGGNAPNVGPGFGVRGRCYARGVWSDLSQEQRDELKALVQDLKDSGATPAKIRDAVAAKLSEWGIEAPTPKAPEVFASLTQEQKDELKALVQGMKDSGATRAEIHDAVIAKLSELGIELPTPQGSGNCWGGMGARGQRGFGRFRGQVQGSSSQGNGQGVRLGKSA